MIGQGMKRCGLKSIRGWRWAGAPLPPDTDDDGLGDGVEVNSYDTDPSDSDSDARASAIAMLGEAIWTVVFFNPFELKIYHRDRKRRIFLAFFVIA